MKRPLRLILYILVSLGIIVVIAGFVANSIIKSKIEKFIESDLPPHIQASYKAISVRILNGSASISEPNIIIGNKNDGVNHTFINGKEFAVSGFSFWEYFKKDEIKIDRIIIHNPIITYHKDLKTSLEDSIPKKPVKFPKPIKIDLFEIDNSEITIFEKGKDSTKLYIKDLNVKVNGIQLNNKTINEKIPIEYRDIMASGDSVFVKANEYNDLMIKNFSLKNKNLTFNNLKYKTKFSKKEFSRVIAVERDHYNVSLESVSVNRFNFGYKNDSLYVDIDEVILDTPSAIIYRDKLVTDDNSIKPLYSKSIREIPFRLTIDSIKIANGVIEYEEKVKQGSGAGSINFKNVDATILNVSNTYSSPTETEIHIKALFMDQTPFSAQWKFDVQNLNDEFTFKGDVSSLEATRMNPFTEPNLGVRLEGRANHTYFTVYGNSNTSRTDLKIKYSDFKVNVLRKDGVSKNKVVSAIVNILISKDSEKKDEKFRESSSETTREKTKSIFSFLWSSIRNALQNALTGKTK